MPTLTLFGTYCNRNGNSWNPDSNQPNVAAWLEGRNNFGQAVGQQVNAGNIFGPGSNTPGSLGGNLKYKFGMVNQVYRNPPYDYIPCIGTKLFQVGDVSPKTGQKYVWNDGHAYQDVADGLWDASWVALVDAMKAMGRTVWFQRVAYEGNAAFMQDFCGYDGKDAAKIDAWCAAMKRVFNTIKKRAAETGCTVLQGINPTTLTQNNPNIENLFAKIGADCQNIVSVDCYNGYWGLAPNKCPQDMSGKAAGVGPARIDLEQTWNSQNGGWGFDQASALALKYGMPLTVQECGSSGGNHHTLDDPYFYPWLAGAIKKHRSKGGTVILVNIWSVPAGDGNTSVQYGSQPTTLNSLRSVVKDIVGDTFDPTLVKFGGGAQPPITPPVDPTPPIQPPITPPDPTPTPPIQPTPPINPAAHDTWVLTGIHPDGSPSSTMTLSLPVGTQVTLHGPT